MADFSPMMKQYFNIKEQYPNCLLFFRLGDFYEMFFNDAKTASRELELTLTGRDCGQEERAPMCGVPFHSAGGYIAKLVEKGYKVAICEQTEDVSASKGIVKREVIRVITPGTVLESSMLDESENNYICSIFYNKAGASVAFADVSTGALQTTELISKNSDAICNFLINEISRFTPKEILLCPDLLDFKVLPNFIREKTNALIECMDEEHFEISNALNTLNSYFGNNYLNKIEINNHPLIISALGAMFTYLNQTQKTETHRINSIDIYVDELYMKLDMNARRNLELTQTMRNGDKKASLLWVLDKTKTAMGKRLIKSWVQQPLLNPAKIILRQNAVSELYESKVLSDDISEVLTGIYDLERIITRIVYGSANGKELRSLHFALAKLPEIKEILSRCTSTLIGNIDAQIDKLEDVCKLIDESIVEEPPFSIREGGIIKEGYSKDLDEIRLDMNGGKDLIAQIEAGEKQKTGIAKLKVGYNRVFGYYIEVTNSFKDKVPEEYIRKQTLTNCERYITQELKVLESRILGASEKSVALEGQIFEEIRKSVANELVRIQSTATAIAELDVLNSFATVAFKNNYSRPTITIDGKIYIKDGRHPVVEQLLNDVPFVPNDTDMDMSNNRVSVITGPNMAGKSTFMRQIALIVIMAQIGSFVPADIAQIGIVDQVFTRVGASDDLSSGQSTFMVEMSEVADILKHATKNSLVILDEIGRGTSTFDGMSIARAVLEYIQNKKNIGAKTLFATHYHELTDMEDLLDGVKNFNIAVKKRGDDISFLRKIVRGGCDDSFGIQVAKLAGVPNKVVQRAKEVLASIEDTNEKPVKKEDASEFIQLSFETTENEIMTKLRNIDVNSLTPIECMNKLFELSSMLD
ncbi:MAG: DNA mismatch repair protein MutS [Clostridia bacterium]